VNGSLRIDVLESQDIFIFENDFCWNIFSDDLAENTVAHLFFPLPTLLPFYGNGGRNGGYLKRSI
jgi:hypothetical protein